MSLATALLDLPRPAKRVVALCIDVLLCVFTVWLAFALRLDEWGLMRNWRFDLAAAAAVLIALPLFIISGFYRAIFRYAGLAALIAIARTLVIYALIYGLIFTVIAVPGVPRTVGLLQPMLLMLLVGASRLVGRYWLGGLYVRRLGLDAPKRALIYGAGSAGRQLAGALLASREMRAVGFIDDDPQLHGSTINGLPVLAPEAIADRLTRLGVTDVLLALPSISRSRRNQILDYLKPLPLHIRTLPHLDDLAHGRVKASDLRELEIEDLLGRDPVAPDEALMGRLITGQAVLVTGAGGSIGSELCRQILRRHPGKLLLLDHAEPALYAVHHELQPLAGSTNVIPLLGSVLEVDRLRQIFADHAPHVVFHAAAYKHVPLVEHNPGPGLRNNVWGTLALATTALASGTSHFVLISTDKAVRPTNIMGASKRLAEQVLQALAVQQPVTCFSMVRFGNVLGSSGSVVPLFRQQIAAGGPVTLTHPEVTRYFMTIPEAAQLVIQAGALARGGEVFVLEMGEPVRIADLARRMVELSGLKLRSDAQPDGDIEIQITGLRPGEKLYEELLIGDNPQPTEHPRIWMAHEQHLDWESLHQELVKLEQEIDRQAWTAVRARLTRLAGLQDAEPT